MGVASQFLAAFDTGRTGSHFAPHRRHTFTALHCGLQGALEMKNCNLVAVLACVAGGVASWPCAALPDESALTIYSPQEPGAISPDFYRPVPGGAVPPAASVPGYALVRQD